MSNQTMPAFLAQGTFLRDGLGYFYSESPPLDLLGPQALASSDPWIVLAAVLERAKIGEFAPVSRLGQLVNPAGDPLLGGACFQLLGDVGTQEAVHLLLSFLGHDSSVYVIRACQALHHVGHLWLIPPMLRAWDRLERPDDRDLVTLILSEMLEEERGPIGDARHSECSSEELHQRVLARAEELRTRLGTDNVAIWGGKIFSVVGLAREMRRLLLSSQKTPFALSAIFLDLREKFEASTGINCSSFYKNELFQPLAASALLEEFLESADSEKYREGMRYFFGHPIPPLRPEPRTEA
jgi:hypothetical protein